MRGSSSWPSVTVAALLALMMLLTGLTQYAHAGEFYSVKITDLPQRHLAGHKSWSVTP